MNWFYGKDYYVGFSNGGAEEFLLALIRIGKVLASDPDEDQLVVLDFLQMLSRQGLGCMSFDVGPDAGPNALTKELDNPVRLRFLLDLINNFAEELAYDLPGLAVMDVNWSHELRFQYWLHRVLLLAEFATETLALKFNLEIPLIQLNLSRFDVLKVKFEQLRSKQKQIKWHENPDLHEKLRITKQLITLAQEEPAVTDWLDFLLDQQFDCVVLLEQLGRKEEALAVLKEMAAQNPTDNDVQSIVEDYIRQLQASS